MKIKEVTDATDGQKEAIKRQEKEIRKKKASIGLQKALSQYRNIVNNFNNNKM